LPKELVPPAINKPSKKNCVTFWSSAVPANLAKLATFGTDKLTFNKITDEALYGLHQIKFELQTAGGIKIGNSPDVPTYLSKPSCEKATLGSLATITSKPIALATKLDVNILNVALMFATSTSGCKQRYVLKMKSTDRIEKVFVDAVTFKCDYTAQTCTATFPSNMEMRDGVHAISVTASSTMNVALNEGTSKTAAAVGTWTVTKSQNDCESVTKSLATKVGASAAPAFYRIGAKAVDVAWGAFTVSPVDCNLLYSVAVSDASKELAPFLTTVTGLRSRSLMIPVGTAPKKNEVAGTHSFVVTATSVGGTVQTKTLTITMKISDPDCEPPTTLKPLLDSGKAYTAHKLMDEQTYIMWSYKVEPVKCRVLMTYKSSVSNDANTGIGVYATDKLRVFIFPKTNVATSLGPHTITVTPSTWEGTAQVNNKWTRAVTVQNPCGLDTVITQTKGDITYLLNSGDLVIDIKRFTTNPKVCKEWISVVALKTMGDLSKIATSSTATTITIANTADATKAKTYPVTFTVQAKTNKEFTFNVIVKNDCPSGPSLVTVPTTA